MDKKKITVADLVAAIERGEGRKIRLCRGELADLFGVYYGTITANIKSLIKSGAVCPNFEGTLVQSGMTIIPEFYDLEMIIALSFRFATPAADKIRRWVVHRATTGVGKPPTPVAMFISERDNRLPN